MIDNPRLAVHRAEWRRRTEFFLVEERPVGDYHHVQPHLLLPDADGKMDWVRQQEGFCAVRPSFSLSDEHAQELFDMMWASGFKPRSVINEASRIEAVTRHLEDMRTIAFDRLKVGAPDRR